MTVFDTYDIISVVGIPIYVAFLGGAIWLSIKHGFSKSSGWRYLIVTVLARLIGFSLRLAIMNDPTNKNLYIAWMTVNGLGLGPLVLVLLGLLSRVFESINRQGTTILKPRYNQLIQLLMLVGIILTIVGGTQSTYTVTSGRINVHYSTASHVGCALMVVVVVLVCLLTLMAFRNQGYIAQGEHRILLGIIASLPLIIVRVVYSCITIFGGVTNSVWLFLSMGVLAEAIVILMLELLGFTLGKASKSSRTEDVELAGQKEGHRHSRR